MVVYGGDEISTSTEGSWIGVVGHRTPRLDGEVGVLSDRRVQDMED